MSDHPELYYWIYLLPLVLLVLWFARYKEGKLSAGDVTAHVFVGGLCYFLLWGMGMFRLLIHPLLLLVFGYLLRLLVKGENYSKIVAGATLGLFLFTGVYAHVLRSQRGAYWELYKSQDASASFGWLANAAKEQRFTRAQLLSHLRSENALVRKNARTIAALHGKEHTDPERAEAFYRALEEVDPDLAMSYLLHLSWEMKSEMNDRIDLESGWSSKEPTY